MRRLIRPQRSRQAVPLPYHISTVALDHQEEYGGIEYGGLPVKTRHFALYPNRFYRSASQIRSWFIRSASRTWSPSCRRAHRSEVAY